MLNQEVDMEISQEAIEFIIKEETPTEAYTTSSVAASSGPRLFGANGGHLA